MGRKQKNKRVKMSLGVPYTREMGSLVAQHIHTLGHKSSRFRVRTSTDGEIEIRNILFEPFDMEELRDKVITHLKTKGYSKAKKK